MTFGDFFRRKGLKMALHLREVVLSLDEDEKLLPLKAARDLGCPPEALRSWRIVRRGVDARKKPRVLRVYTLELTCDDEASLLARNRENRRLAPAKAPVASGPLVVNAGHRALVAGMGPAGLFAALRLAEGGSAVTLVERGRPVEARVKDVRRFWNEGLLDPVSNVQFGEGGAGTFSDGKLTTRVNDPRMRYILETLVRFGAPSEILEQAKPHVGTDRLRLVLINFRRALQQLGVDIRFETCLTGLESAGGRVRAGILDGRDEVPCDSLVLAPGHSARDTYRMLQQRGVLLEAKPFAVGVRVEHPVELINEIQYGHAAHPRLPTAEYALSWNDRQSGRGIYSFCMCPGGEVVNASSEAGGLVVNGMSHRRRDGRFSNSALVVSVRTEDFGAADPLGGIAFQRALEQKAFAAGGGRFLAPAQNLLAFLGRGQGPVRSTCRPGVVELPLEEVLPGFVAAGLRSALPQFERRMRGFVCAEATLVGVETRTSAPVRIVRGEDGQSISHPGLFPAGEGAGYAGGIMSAALDGLRAAERIAMLATHRSSL